MKRPYKDKKALERFYSQGYTDKEIAEECGCAMKTVQYWKHKFEIVKDDKKAAALRKVGAEQVDKEISEAGGVGQWAQRKIKERYAQHEYLANLYIREGKLDGASREMDRADDLLKELAPSRSKINPEKPIKGPTSADHKVLIGLNELLDNIKEDAIFEGGNTAIEDAWGKRIDLSSIQPKKDDI